MKCLSISKTDKLLDYGSGKGYAMLFFSKYSFSEIGGVEYNASLHETAKNNFKLKDLSHLISYNYNAAQFQDIDRYTYFFFYNPFLGKVMESTIVQIQKSLERNCRKITILYQNPIEHNILVNSKLFPFIMECFVPSLINFNKDNKRYGRQFINIYCTESLDIDFGKYGVKIIERDNVE